MRKIEFICDNCLKTIDKQVCISGELEKAYLFKVANQEWCYACMDKIGLNLSFAEKFKIMTPEEIELYAKKI